MPRKKRKKKAPRIEPYMPSLEEISVGCIMARCRAYDARRDVRSSHGGSKDVTVYRDPLLDAGIAQFDETGQDQD